MVERAENNMKRSENISRLIANNRRSYGGSGDRPLSGCEVCWTCTFFAVECNKCILSYEDVKRMGGARFEMCRVDYYESDDVYVKNPEWFRCRWWK